MKVTRGYITDERNNRLGVLIPNAEWKRLKQRLLDAEMQFYEIKRLEAEIRQTDLLAALPEVLASEAGNVLARTITEAFASSDNLQLAESTTAGFPILALPSFINKAAPLIQKYPALTPELFNLPYSKLGSFASRVGNDHLAFRWLIERAKTKKQPKLRIEVVFICKYSETPKELNGGPIYLAVIYDKSDQKLVQPEPLDLL